MEDKKNERFFYNMLIIIAVVAIAGMALILFLNRQNGAVAAFEMLAFGLSVAAISFSMLHSIIVARHMRITRHNAGKITETINKLEELIHEDRQLVSILKDDLVLDELIAKSLENLGKTNISHKKASELTHKIQKDLLKTESGKK